MVLRQVAQRDELLDPPAPRSSPEMSARPLSRGGRRALRGEAGGEETHLPPRPPTVSPWPAPVIRVPWYPHRYLVNREAGRLPGYTVPGMGRRLWPLPPVPGRAGTSSGRCFSCIPHSTGIGSGCCAGGNIFRVPFILKIENNIVIILDNNIINIYIKDRLKFDMERWLIPDGKNRQPSKTKSGEIDHR